MTPSHQAVCTQGTQSVGSGAKLRVVRNSALNFVGQILPLAIGVLTIPYVIRGLGTDAFGILSIAATLLGYFSIFDLGLGRATTKYVADYLNPDKIEGLARLIYTSVFVQVMLGIAAALGTIAAVPILVERVFAIPTALIPEARLCLLILGASVPILLCNNAFRGVLEAAQRFDLVNYVKVPTSISFYASAAVAIPLHWRLSTIITVSVLARAVATLTYALLCLHLFPQLKIFRLSRAELRHLLSFGGWVMVSTMAGQMFAYLERFMIASILSVGLLTYYAAPFELISKILIFPASAATALFPFASRHGRMQPALVTDLSARLLKYLLFAMSPVLAVFVAFSGTILQLWLGRDFAAQSTVVLQVLAVAFFLNSLAFIPFTSVQALGRPDLKAILDVLALPAFAIYAWVLMRHTGIAGAAWAKLISSSIDCGFLFFFARKVKAFEFRSLISGPLSRCLLLGAALTAALVVVSSLDVALVWSGVLTLACMSLYVLGFWHYAADEDDKEALRGVPRRFVIGSASVSTPAD